MRRLGVAALLVCAGTLAAQVYVPGPQVAAFRSDVDDSDQPYGLYLPKNFDPAKKYPLVISLHGAGSNHRVNLRQVFGRGLRPGETSAEASRYFPPFRDVDAIVATPLARGSMGYLGIAEKDVYDVLADVKKRFPIDDDRVYLTGVSMGGGGALRLGLTRPDVWAAIAAVCPVAPDGTEELAPNALNLAVHLFHGDQDAAVSVEVSRKWMRLLRDLDTYVEYVEYPNIRHNAWDYAYKDGAIFDWFAKFRRDRFPDRVRFTTRAYKYSLAYWVRLDGLTPGELASIDARFAGANRIEVKTAGLDGFTLNLAGHPKFSSAEMLSVTVDGAAHRLRTRGPVSFSRAGAGWKAALYVPSKTAKRPGLEGPVGEAIAARHVYVYGTLDAPAPEELKRRREEAARAAEWSTPRSRLLVSFRALSDKEADPATGNLVLFGNKVTNRLILRFAGQLPLDLNPGAADYGLVYVAPVGGHYVVVNSGLPWWTGAEQVKRPGPRFDGAPFTVLLGLGDYIVFKGSLVNVVAEGRFDRNWKLPAADAAKIQATGAILIR